MMSEEKKNANMNEDASMMECWLIHPIDDDDCLNCPNVKDCREVRKAMGKLEQRPPNRFHEIPQEWIGVFHNGSCPDACDMFIGPCACGATHNPADWLRRVKEVSTWSEVILDMKDAKISELERIIVEAKACLKQDQKRIRYLEKNNATLDRSLHEELAASANTIRILQERRDNLQYVSEMLQKKNTGLAEQLHSAELQLVGLIGWLSDRLGITVFTKSSEYGKVFLEHLEKYIQKLELSLTGEIKRIRKIADERECNSCGQCHPIDTMCPPHEVRMKGNCWYHKVIKTLKSKAEGLQINNNFLRKENERYQDDLQRTRNRLDVANKEADEARQTAFDILAGFNALRTKSSNHIEHGKILRNMFIEMQMAKLCWCDSCRDKYNYKQERERIAVELDALILVKEAQNVKKQAAKNDS